MDLSIDLTEVERWSIHEGYQEKFLSFMKNLKEVKNPRTLKKALKFTS